MEVLKKIFFAKNYGLFNFILLLKHGYFTLNFLLIKQLIIKRNVNLYIILQNIDIRPILLCEGVENEKIFFNYIFNDYCIIRF